MLDLSASSFPSALRFDAPHTSLPSGSHAAPAREPLNIEVPGVAEPTTVRIASTTADHRAAFALLADSYRERGYEESDGHRYRFTPHLALPDAATFVAQRADRVVATLSLVPDTLRLGLPLESIYGPEVDALRRDGRRLAEPTCLAARGLGSTEFVHVLTALTRLMMQHHLQRGGDTFVIAVHPRHAAYYQKTLGFDSLGPLRSHPSVLGAPALAFLSDPDRMRRNAPRMHRRIFGDPLPREALRLPARPASHARYFAERSSCGDRRGFGELLQDIEREGCPPRWQSAEVCSGL